MCCRSRLLVVGASCLVLIVASCSGEVQADPVAELEVRQLAELGSHGIVEAVLADGKAMVAAGSNDDRVMWVCDIETSNQLWTADAVVDPDI